MMKKAGVLAVALLVLPVVAGAQNFGYLNNAVSGLQGLVDTLLPVAVGVAVLVFIWGLIKFILAAGDDDGRKEGKLVMIWGVVALFVIVGLWSSSRFLLISPE